MSKEDLYQAINIIEKNWDKANFSGSKNEDLIEKAEKVLGLDFPPTYKEFLLKYGCGGFNGEEFYGIISNNFQDSCVPDAIWVTLKHRKVSGLPESMIIFYTIGDGSYFALDARKKDESGEYAVVCWEPGFSASEHRLEIIADDFGQFFYDTIKEACKNH